MCPNGDQGTLAAQVLVQLVLQVNEAVVAHRVESDAPQNGRHCERPDQRCLWLDQQTLLLLACDAGMRSFKHNDTRLQSCYSDVAYSVIYSSHQP